MCYPRDSCKERIVSKFPQEMEEMEDMDGLMDEDLTSPLFAFRTFIGDIIIWLIAMKPSRDSMSISRILVKMFFDFKHVISNQLLENKLKAIYGRTVVNERRYESILNDYIKLFEEIQKTMDQYIIDYENCVGDLEKVILLNRFHKYSEGIVAHDYQNLYKNVLNLNKLHQKTQMTLYEKFINNLWKVRNI